MTDVASFCHIGEQKRDKPFVNEVKAELGDNESACGTKQHDTHTCPHVFAAKEASSSDSAHLG